MKEELLVEDKDTIDEIARAIYIVNRHAKTAPEPQHLYTIKKEALSLLLKKNKAKKIGLHFSNNPKFSNQYSTLLIQVRDYYFHLPPSKEDFKNLKHLGSLDHNFRNPRTKMSLSYAKKIIYEFIDWKETSKKKEKKKTFSSYYTPSSLGKMDWTSRRYTRYH